MKTTIFKDNNALAQQVVAELSTLKLGARVLIPSGSTPHWIYDVLSTTSFTKNLTFFALDEWLKVPSEMDGSCLSMINADFINQCPHPVKLIHFDPFYTKEQNVAIYESVLNGAEFDYVILGVGMNGHIGLNEPGVDLNADYLVTKLDDLTIEVARKKYFSGTVALSEGMTVGINKIIKSKKIIVIVNNEAKKDIYREVVNGNPQNTNLPAVYIKQFSNVNYYITENIEG